MRLRVEQGGAGLPLAALEPGSCRALRVDPAAVRDWHVHQQEVAKEEEGKTKSLFLK